MNVSFDLDPATIGLPKSANPPSGCDLDCKNSLFHSLADRARLRILETLCQGAKTVEQITVATVLPQTDVSIQVDRLVDCGCVTSKHSRNSVLYELSTPRLLQLEAVVDEMLLASLKHRVSDQD
jgi:DNA-binding transcriptional ArsR family regulator